MFRIAWKRASKSEMEGGGLFVADDYAKDRLWDGSGLDNSMRFRYIVQTLRAGGQSQEVVDGH